MENTIVSKQKKNKQQTKEENVDETEIPQNEIEDLQTIQQKKENDFNNEYFSDIKFENMDLSENTIKALDDLKYTIATEIQSKTIPVAMKGVDIMGAAKTGSGKSLSFLIPAVEFLHKTNFQQKNGLGVLVLTPTRELALQLYNLAKDLMAYHKKTCALIIGGANRKVEAEKLIKGVNLVIATPGRLLDHLKNTKNFNYKNLSMLIIDEADAILKIGFEEELKEIINIIPKERQTLLFSATLGKKIEDLITLSLRDPIYIKAGEQNVATVSTLEQGYVVVSPDKKFLLLYTFIRKNIDKKIMVFFSSCNAVKFYSYLLNYVDIPVKDIHGNQKQQKRTTTYFEFCNSEKGVLLCTDVAQRGLDIPDVDWIIQYDPPHEPTEYLHRVGRTARGANAKGKALLILLPNELGLVRYLKSNKINISEYDFPETKLAKIQDQYEKLVEKNYYLHTSARDAYRSYLHSYVSHTLKDVYNVNDLDLSKVCRSFGFTSPPFVNLNLKFSTNTQRKKKFKDEVGDKKALYSKGYNSNKNDDRQFVR